MHCGWTTTASQRLETETTENDVESTKLNARWRGWRITQTYNIYYDCIINCLQYGADDKNVCLLPTADCRAAIHREPHTTMHHLFQSLGRWKPEKPDPKGETEKKNSSRRDDRRAASMLWPLASGRRYRPTDEIYWSVHLSDETHISSTKLYFAADQMPSQRFVRRIFDIHFRRRNFRQIFEDPTEVHVGCWLLTGEGR